MSLPVPYTPGDIRHDIRNTREGAYYFVPTELIVHAFMFILATAARRYEVGIVAYAMMCNHIHVLVVDLRDDGKSSDVPGFRSFVRSTFSQFIRRYWKLERGMTFCPDSTGDSVRVIDFASVEEAISYIETNHAAAGMEKSPELMRGATSLREWLVAPVTVRRPSFWFQKRTWRDSEVLKLEMPREAIKKGESVESFYARTKALVDQELVQIMKRRKRAKLSARPLHVLRRLTPRHGRGRSVADHSEALVACKNPALSAQEFERVRAFRRAHAKALEKLKAGDSDVVFPLGTYLAAKRYGVRVRTTPEVDDPQDE